MLPCSGYIAVITQIQKTKSKNVVSGLRNKFDCDDERAEFNVSIVRCVSDEFLISNHFLSTFSIILMVVAG